MDTKGIKNLYKLTLPSIKFRKKLYLRRMMPEITLEFISSMIININEKQVDSYKIESNYNSILKDNSSYSSNIFTGENILDRIKKEDNKRIIYNK